MLIRDGALELIADQFGPPMYKATASFKDWYEETAPTKYSVFAKFDELGQDEEWLRAAIRNVNSTFSDLGITEYDFPAEEIDEWEPIPLDKSDPTFQEMTGTLEVAVKAIEQDNGYAVSHPGERDHVVAQLKDFLTGLQKGVQVYWPQVKTHALDPLTRVIKRFGDAAVGIAAFAARQAIVDWIKANFAKALQWLFW